MDARKSNIYEILSGNKQFLVPVYQRYYCWEIEQCRRLWNDIIEMQRKGKEWHFVGSIVNIMEQAMPIGVQKFMLIDGQQRMTTLTLLLIALRNYGFAHPEESLLNPQKIDNVLLRNEYETGEEKYKLLLTKIDREILISMIERKPIAKDMKSKLIENYFFFMDKIAEMEITPFEVYQSIGKLQIVNISLDRASDDAQSIFESLNSTGKELSESDLIRNYILMGLEQEEQNDIYENYWHPMELMFDYEVQDSVMDRFFRDYLTMKSTRIPRQDKVYDEFKYYHLNCEFSSIRDFCSDLMKYAGFYTDMFFKRSNDKELKRLYDDINELKMEVSYPFLLKVHNDCLEQIITLEELKEIVNLCISYVFRRSICDIPTNSLNKTFATMRNFIRKDDYINSVRAFFILREDYKEFPNDDNFEIAFKNKDIYHMRSRNFILRHLENFKNKGWVAVENYTIEHIMPQNPKLSEEWQKDLGKNWKEVQKKYLHTIGNLTLTAYDSEMSDHSFQEKMKMEGGFQESALRLNAYVVKQTEWNESKIQERADLLAQKAKEIWKYPVLEKEILTSYQQEGRPTQKYSLDSYGMNSQTKELFDLLDKRIINLSPNVKREFKKLYIAYKLDTNFVDIVVQKQRLRLVINMKYSDIYDPKGICKDSTGLGKWGNGDVELFMEQISDIDSVMQIVEQSYQVQSDDEAYKK